MAHQARKKQTRFEKAQHVCLQTDILPVEGYGPRSIGHRCSKGSLPDKKKEPPFRARKQVAFSTTTFGHPLWVPITCGPFCNLKTAPLFWLQSLERIGRPVTSQLPTWNKLTLRHPAEAIPRTLGVDVFMAQQRKCSIVYTLGNL